MGSLLILTGFCIAGVIYCFWESIKVAIAIIDAAADFFISTKRLVFVQILYFISSMIVIFLWFGAQVAVYAMNPFNHPTNE